MEADFPRPQGLRRGLELGNNSLVIASTLKFHIDLIRDHMFSFAWQSTQLVGFGRGYLYVTLNLQITLFE